MWEIILGSSIVMIIFIILLVIVYYLTSFSRCEETERAFLHFAHITC